MRKLVSCFIIWARRRAPRRVRVASWHRHENRREFNFSRFEFLWPDEPWRENIPGKFLPWWRPFNVLLHCWAPKCKIEEFHSHPRWTITIVIRGKLFERRPNGTEKALTPGSIVVRSHKSVHAFRIPEGYSGKTWTIFICGRRRHGQTFYLYNESS